MPQFVLSRFKPCPINGSLTYPDSFSEYVEITKTHIENCRTDLTTDNRDKVIQANIPFEYQPTQPTENAIILFHGLLDSTYSMRELGHFFCQQGYLVRAPLLPGHGTRPGDLLNISVSDWLKATEYAINVTKKKVKNIYLVGFSGGASLALYHALTRKDIQGVITMAPSFRLLNKAAYLSGLIHVYGQYRKKTQWFKRQSEIDYARYEAFPANLASQALSLTKQLRTTFKNYPLKTPWQLILTEDDETVCSKTALKIFNTTPNSKNKALIYAKSMPLTTIPSRVEYRISKHLKDNIVDFSHICLPLSATNPHYGKNGDQKMITLPALNSSKAHGVIKGAISKSNRKNYNLQRLTYNPDFNYMTAKMLNFFRGQ